MAHSAADAIPGYLDALAVQGRVIWALMLRESRTRFWRNRLGYVWALFEPITHVAVWFVIYSVMIKNPIGDRTVQILFLITGMLPFMAFRNTSQFMETAIAANRPLLSFPMVRHLDLVVARWLLEAATLTIVTTIIISTLVASGYSKMPQNITGLGAALAIQFALGFGFGICNAVFSLLSLLYARIEDLVSRLLYFVSGIFFSINNLPEDFKQYLVWNPVAHGVELFRMSYFPQHQTSFASVSYPLLCAFGLTLCGLAGMRLAKERLNTA